MQVLAQLRQARKPNSKLMMARGNRLEQAEFDGLLNGCHSLVDQPVAALVSPATDCRRPAADTAMNGRFR